MAEKKPAAGGGTIEQLVGRIFASRDYAHLRHWATGSYSEHVALGEFYDGIVDDIDEIVEVFQGAFDLIGEVPRLPLTKGLDAVQHLRAEAEWIHMNREPIARDCCAIENLIDGVLASYYKTIYKLRFLD